jgi:outer membrane immunogenic protein
VIPETRDFLKPITMKKALLVVMISCFAITSNAQFNIGVKGVINVSNIKVEGQNSDAKVGFAGGPYAEFYFSGQFGVSTELLYNEKGARAISGGTEIKTNLNYLSIPVLFYFEPFRNFKLGLGPELAFLLTAKAKADSMSKMDIKKYFESFDKALAFGAAYSFGRMGISARYVAGFDQQTTVNFSDIEGGTEAVKQSLRNNVIQIAVNVKLNKGKTYPKPASTK